VEALTVKSDSLITARLAAEQGRNVYVPAPDALHGYYAEGTKQLLMDGAFPIYRAEDLMADLFPHLRRALLSMPEPAMPHEEEKRETSAPVATIISERPASSKPLPCVSNDEALLLYLLQGAPLSPDDILLAAQEKDESWSAPRLLSALMMLEVKGLVRRLSDSRYEVRP